MRPWHSSCNYPVYILNQECVLYWGRWTVIPRFWFHNTCCLHCNIRSSSLFCAWNVVYKSCNWRIKPWKLLEKKTKHLKDQDRNVYFASCNLFSSKYDSVCIDAKRCHLHKYHSCPNNFKVNCWYVYVSPFSQSHYVFHLQRKVGNIQNNQRALKWFNK